jgi:hypothetical protein
MESALLQMPIGRRKAKVTFDACTPTGGVRLSGLTGTTAGVTSWAGHPAVAVFLGSIALIYALLIWYLAVTALRTAELARRSKTALEILKVLGGANVSTQKAKGSREIQSPAKADGAS